ncbi:MAG: carboxypeptidase regulatory-like domain-containing protein [Pseudomonadota bacterium]
MKHYSHNRRNIFVAAVFFAGALFLSAPPVHAHETYFQPALGDIRWESAGPERVLVTDDGGWFATTYLGESLFKTAKFFSDEVIITSPVLANVAGDALHEIIFVTRNASLGERVVVLDGNGAVLSAAPLGDEHATGDPVAVVEGNRTASDIVLGTKSGAVLRFRVNGANLESAAVAQISGPAWVGGSEFHTEFAVTSPGIAAASRYAWSGSAWTLQNELTLPAPFLYHALLDGGNIYGVNTRGEIAAFDKQSGAAVANFPVAVSGFPVAAPQFFDYDANKPGKEIMAPLQAGKRAIIAADGTVVPGASGASRGVKRSQTERADTTFGGFVNGGASPLGTSYVTSPSHRTALSPLSRGLFSPPTGSGDIHLVYDGHDVAASSSITLTSFAVGETRDIAIVIENRGTGDLVLTGNETVTLTNTIGTAFTLIAKPASLIPAGGNAALAIRFTPGTSGEQRATLTMTSTDADTPAALVTLRAREAAAPGVPENFVAAPRDSAVALSWQAPTDTGSDDITEYTIEYRPAGSALPFSEDARMVRVTHASTTTNRVIDQLDNGVTYEFRAAAVNRIGTGVFTEPVTARPTLLPIVLEDAEDGDTLGWFISDDGAPGTVTNDDAAPERNSRVVTLHGTWNNVFIFKHADGTWLETTGHPVLSYDTSMESLMVTVKVITTKGDRQITYIPYAVGPQNPPYFQMDSRSGIPDGTWRTVLHNIAQDIASLEPDAVLVSIDGLFFRGGGMVDDIRLLPDAALYTASGRVTNALGDPMPGVKVTLKPDNRVATTDAAGRYIFTGLVSGDYQLIPELPTIAFTPVIGAIAVRDQSVTRDFAATEISSLVYDDAEDGQTNGWFVSDDGEGGTIENVVDETKGSRVIALFGNGWSSVFGFQNDDGTPWRLRDYPVVEFDTMTDGNIVTINVETTSGDRSLNYDPRGSGGAVPSYQFDGRTGIPEGVWRTVSFDVGRDIAMREPGTMLIDINSIRIRGPSRIDNVIFRKAPTVFAIQGVVHDASGSPMADTRVTLAPGGRDVLTDAGGMFRFAGLPAGTYTLSLEKTSYTFSGVPSSIVITNQSVSVDAVGTKSDSLVMEDAEDGLTTPWISDTGGVITNTIDPEKGHVISFTAPSTNIQHTLMNPNVTFWRIAGYSGVQWDMRFSGTVYFSIPIDTTAGDKVITYSPNFLAPSTDGFRINVPLPNSNNGVWQTISRNLEADLRSVLPDASLQSIKYFGVRGAGSVDNIVLLR